MLNEFSKTVSSQMAKTVSKSVNPAQFINELGGLYNQYLEYKKVELVEQNKRLLIQSQTQIKLTELENKRQIFMAYLDKSFDERRENFKQLFERLDKSLEKEDIQTTAIILNSISDIAKSSPFKGLMDIDIATMDRNTELEL